MKRQPYKPAQGLPREGLFEGGSNYFSGKKPAPPKPHREGEGSPLKEVRWVGPEDLEKVRANAVPLEPLGDDRANGTGFQELSPDVVVSGDQPGGGAAPEVVSPLLPLTPAERAAQDQPRSSRGDNDAAASQPCANCRASMKASAILCTACGYNHAAGRREHSDDAASDAPGVVCAGCGYDLAGLREPQCPECGATVDVARMKNSRAEDKGAAALAELPAMNRDGLGLIFRAAVPALMVGGVGLGLIWAAARAGGSGTSLLVCVFAGTLIASVLSSAILRGVRALTGVDAFPWWVDLPRLQAAGIGVMALCVWMTDLPLPMHPDFLQTVGIAMAAVGLVAILYRDETTTETALVAPMVGALAYYATLISLAFAR